MSEKAVFLAISVTKKSSTSYEDSGSDTHAALDRATCYPEGTVIAARGSLAISR